MAICDIFGILAVGNSDQQSLKPFFLGGVCAIKYFFQFWRYEHDSKYEKIQNMKNIKSKFRIDLEYFSQDLVNSRRFKSKSNSRIFENS